jgi:hypothetical protein
METIFAKPTLHPFPSNFIFRVKKTNVGNHNFFQHTYSNTNNLLNLNTYYISSHDNNIPKIHTPRLTSQFFIGVCTIRNISSQQLLDLQNPV